MCDPYAILGLTPDATKEDVQRRFRELAKKTHPDMHRGNKEFEERFKMYSEAYNMILSEKELYERIEKDADFFHQHFRQREAEPSAIQKEAAPEKERKTENSAKNGDSFFSYEEYLLHLQKILKEKRNEEKRKKKEAKVAEEEKISIPELFFAFWWIVVIIINIIILL